jgi:L-ascorbate metabolism protein UlaG (beta-lactamase superfamily)
MIDSPAIEVTYIGGPTALLRAAGVTFITDPTFDAGGRTYNLGAVTLQKLAGPARAADALGTIDVALVSHAQHADNLDDAGRALLKDIPLVLTTRPSATSLGGHAVGLAPGESRTVKGLNGITLKITATPARHGPVGIEKATGEVVGFVITVVASGEDLAYVTGDTVWYEGTAEVARKFHPRIVLPFVGGAMTARGPIYLTMNTNDAISLAAAFPYATLVPVHHEGWGHFTQSQQDLQKAFAAVGLEKQLQKVVGGETYVFESAYARAP